MVLLFRIVIFLSSILGWDSANSKRLFCAPQSTTGILGEEFGDIDIFMYELDGDESGGEIRGEIGGGNDRLC